MDKIFSKHESMSQFIHEPSLITEYYKQSIGKKLDYVYLLKLSNINSSRSLCKKSNLLDIFIEKIQVKSELY